MLYDIRCRQIVILIQLGVLLLYVLNLERGFVIYDKEREG